MKLIPVVAAVVVLTAAGCGASTSTPSHTPGPASALPPRPATLSLDDVDPCSLLTDTQRAQLQVRRGSPDTDSSGPFKGRVCTWLDQNDPNAGYDGTAALHQGAEFALGGEPVRSVGGFAATTTVSAGTDPNRFCGLLVDVASGQSLAADYSNNGHDYPGMNRELACFKAQQLAEAMLSTLRAQQHR